MNKISRKLSEWSQQQLISAEQLQAIETYEANLPRTKWGQVGIFILGIGTIVLGVVAIIAANWEKIPPSIKLTGGFAVLIATAITIVAKRNEKSVFVHEGLLAFFSLYCFGMIGLIAQIYNLHGDGYKTGLFWSAITFLVVSQARHFLLPLIWAGVFGLSFLVACFEWPPFKEYLNSHFSFYIYALTLAVLISRRFFAKALLQRTMEHFTVAMWIIALMLSSIDFRPFNAPVADLTKNLVQYGLSAVIAMALLTDSSFKKFERIVFIAGLVLFDILLTIGFSKDAPILSIILSMFCLLVWSIFFLGRDFTKLFNLTLLLVAFKIFEIYAREVQDLLSTGFGFIGMGVVMIACVYVWSKNRQKIERRLQEILK